ncbi:uncharacterized protein LOC126571585 isoform X1 [Anopheles aquasalis]|uniref:uncharacterized protein LOC126571585 isoform X1 n=1 Tax=Anopheles aquasalis TaxID=42839 RepID=UPI00215A6C3B|nr:uncharacterized protein LOC126571585 isoform X1 [Anopheles aquasalis]
MHSTFPLQSRFLQNDESIVIRTRHPPVSGLILQCNLSARSQSPAVGAAKDGMISVLHRILRPRPRAHVTKFGGSGKPRSTSNSTPSGLKNYNLRVGCWECPPRIPNENTTVSSFYPMETDRVLVQHDIPLHAGFKFYRQRPDFNPGFKHFLTSSFCFDSSAEVRVLSAFYRRILLVFL